MDLNTILSTSSFHLSSWNPWIYSYYVVGFSILVLVWKKWNERASHPLLKYVKGYPLIGVLIDFIPINGLETAKQYPTKYGPFIECYILNQRTLFITDVEIGKELLMKRPKIFRRFKSLTYASNVIGMEKGLFHCNGSIWNHIRKSMAPSFSNMNVISKLKPIGQELFHWMDRLTKESKKNPQQEINMKFQAFSLTIRVISIVAFGLDTNHPISSYFFSLASKEDIEKVFKFFIESALFFLPTICWKYSSKYQYEIQAREAGNRFSSACQQIIDYKRQLIQQQGKNYTTTSMIDSLLMKRKDLISSSTPNENEIPDTESTASSGVALSDEEIIANVKTVYMAGSDTTSIVITWMTYYFAVYPEICQQVREEFQKVFQVTPTTTREEFLNHALTPENFFQKLSFTFACIKETCRVTGPASLNGTQLETGELSEGMMKKRSKNLSFTLSNGIVIYPDDMVWVNIDGIHYQEKVFPDPYTFKPDRWLIKDLVKLNEMENNFFAFGYGPRVCPGMTLAYYEATLASAFLAYHFDFQLNCPKEEVVRVRSFGSTPSKVPVLLTQVNRILN